MDIVYQEMRLLPQSFGNVHIVQVTDNIKCLFLSFHLRIVVPFVRYYLTGHSECYIPGMLQWCGVCQMPGHPSYR